MDEFDGFFHFCEKGFRNELIVNMLCRNHAAGTEVFNKGEKVFHIYFILQGYISIFKNDRAKIPKVQYRPKTWFGDFQVLF